MEEKLYQNIDVPQQNPLETVPETTSSAPKKLSPKIILVISLLSLVFVLFLISILFSQSKNSSTSIIPTPTQAPTNNSTINDSLIPTQYQKNFKEIEQSLSLDPDLPIPQIDTEVGL